MQTGDQSTRGHARGLLILCAVAVMAGALAGLVGTAFRQCLILVDRFRIDSVSWLHQWPGVGWLVPMITAGIAVALARWLVVVVPTAGGSGIQRVEASVRSQVSPETSKVIPVKFVGGLLAIGSGLALGREGPTVQMAAAIGSKFSRALKMDRDDQNVVQASLAGAGLGVAFNAPLAGAIFVVEELTRSVRTRLLLATLLATTSAATVMRVLIGNAADFATPVLPGSSSWGLLPYLVFGALVGLLGAWYNRLVLRAMTVFDQLDRIPLVLRAGIVGAAVGLLGWFLPAVVGGGDNLTAELLVGALPMLTVAGILALRWFLGPVSYSVGAPGGLFAPLLLVGAASGTLFGGAVHAVAAGWAPDPRTYTLVGMAVFFTAVVRSPITGVVLVTEMTATTTQLLPMMVACATAVAATTLVGSEPIYDTLRHRMLARDGALPD